MKMLNIYTKQIHKNWFAWSLISIIMAAFSLLMALIWPSFEEMAEALEAMMQIDLIVGLLGEGVHLTSLEGLLSSELFIMSDIFFMGLILLFSIQCIPREVESGSLDFMLSFPVPRWRFLLEKLFAFITVTLSYPILTAGGAILGAVVIGVEFQSYGLEAFFLGLFSRWALYITLTCIVILISVIFMDTGKTLIFGGLLLGGSWLLDTLGGLVLIADATIGELIQKMSPYYYLDGPLIMKDILTDGLSGFPLVEFLLILAIGVVAIFLSLVIFDNPFRQKREFK